MAKDINKHFETVAEYLRKFEKEKAIGYCMSLLEDGTVSVAELYEEILAPALNRITILRAQEDSLIWQEHVMTAIVRSIVECTRPYVIKEKAANAGGGSNGKVMLVCPEDEYHELGIRMGTDFFTIANYEAVFIGGNTPQENILSAVEQLQPDIVNIGISNFINLVSLKKIILELRAKISPNIKITVSGSAFKRTGTDAADFGADFIVNSFSDILALGRNNHETGI